MPNSNVMVDPKFRGDPATQRQPLAISPSIAKAGGPYSARPSKPPLARLVIDLGCNALTTTWATVIRIQTRWLGLPGVWEWKASHFSGTLV